MSGFGTVMSGFGGALSDQMRENSPLYNSVYSRYRRQPAPQAPMSPSFDPSLTGQPPPPGMSEPMEGPSPEMMGRGKIVTTPTLARVGEKGPEMVVPLNPRPQNRLNPDLLEGHITDPKVPGVRYSRYKSFVNRAL